MAEMLPPGWAVEREQYSRHIRTKYILKYGHCGPVVGVREFFAHPWLWTLTEPDGYQRCFDTRREAVAFAREYEGLPVH